MTRDPDDTRSGSYTAAVIAYAIKRFKAVAHVCGGLVFGVERADLWGMLMEKFDGEV